MIEISYKRKHMKKSGKNILYLTIIILIITIVILIGSIINLSKTNKIVENEDKSKGQLTETTDDNTYVSMSTHLSEISKQVESLSTLKMVAYSAGVWTNAQTITVPEGVTEGILVAVFGQYDTSAYATGSINIKDASGIESQEVLITKSSQGNSAGCKINMYQCKLIPGNTISINIKKSEYTTNTNKGATMLILLSNTGEAIS